MDDSSLSGIRGRDTYQRKKSKKPQSSQKEKPGHYDEDAEGILDGPSQPLPEQVSHESSVEDPQLEDLPNDSNTNEILTDDENGTDKAPPPQPQRRDRSSAQPEIVPAKVELPSQPISRPDSVRPKEPRSISYGYLAVGAVVFLAIAIFVPFAVKYWNSKPNCPAKGLSCENFLQLRSKYPNTDDSLWSTLIVGVDRAVIKDPGEPSTFIFLYNSSDVSKSLLDDVTRIAIDCFCSGGAIWRTSGYYSSAEIVQDYGLVLDEHREELKSRGVLVVQNLDRVPPTAAKAFFPICDSYEPLVRRAIIFFTIDISGQPPQVVHSERSATSIAEGILKDLWRGELHPNMLDPLLVRLTENVFRIA